MEVYSLVLICVLGLSCICQLVSSQVCSNKVDLRQFNANPSVYSEVPALALDDRCFANPPGFGCLSGSVLDDNVQVPQPPNLDSEETNNDIDKFVAWHRDSGSPYISFRLETPVPAVTSLHIEFLNYPAMNISLPNLQLYESAGISIVDPQDSRLQLINYDLLSNSGLFQDDFTVTTVSMTFSSVTSQYFLLYWDYTDVYNLDLFLVSEVYFCSDTPPTNNVQIDFLTPHVNNVTIIPAVEEFTTDSMRTLFTVLNCTVSSAGLFEWQWRQNGSIISNSDTHSLHIFIADGSRTSKLLLSGPSVGVSATYSCEVRHVRGTCTTFVSRTQILSFPAIMDGPATMNGYLNSGQVTLTCEVYGFLRSMNPLKWLDGVGNLLADSAKYTITSSASSRPAVLISSRASTDGQRSTLTISQLSEGDEGNYSCVADGNSTTIQLLVLPGSASSTTSVKSSDPIQGICNYCIQTAVTASIISSLITAIITASISALVAVLIGKVIINKKTRLSSGSGAATGEGETVQYEVVDDSTRVSAMTMKTNEAYATTNNNT